MSKKSGAIQVSEIIWKIFGKKSAALVYVAGLLYNCGVEGLEDR